MTFTRGPSSHVHINVDSVFISRFDSCLKAAFGASMDANTKSCTDNIIFGELAALWGSVKQLLLRL